jgi:class 3 adenylate cyclase
MGLHETDYERTQDGTAALADVGGVAVHIGARIAASAGASEVLVSSTVKDLAAGSGLVFKDASEHELSRASRTVGGSSG